jgi:hypothetical protein
MRRVLLPCLFALCGVCAAPCAIAQQLPSAAPDSREQLYPGTREYRWSFHVPVLTMERRQIIVQALVPTIRSRQLEYEAPGLRAQRFKLWQLAEFHCKYPDWWRLPNECGVHWHNVYADLPVLIMERSHVDYEAAEWGWRERRIGFDVPRWTWQEQTLRVIVPVFSAERSAPPEWSQGEAVMLARDIDRARTTLADRRADTVRIVRNAVAALDSRIDSLSAQDVDPRRLTTAEGEAIDLVAARRALLDEEARELERFARISAELESSVSGWNGSGAPSRR